MRAPRTPKYFVVRNCPTIGAIMYVIAPAEEIKPNVGFEIPMENKR